MADILLVEDDDTLRLLLARQLTRGGHSVVECADGLSALTQLGYHSFDLVLTDMKMPRLDGMGLLEQARERGLDAEFVVLTGHGSLEAAVEAFKVGNVADYLLKPLDDIRLLNVVVERALERQSLRSDNSRLVAELQHQLDEQEAAHRQLARSAEEDPLTGVSNRRSLQQALNYALMAHSTVPITVVLVDILDLAEYNTRYGHRFGDHVLRHVAQSLRRTVGPEVPLGHLFADTFALVLTSPVAGVPALLDRLHTDLRTAPLALPDGGTALVGLRVGQADTTRVGRESARLLAAAHLALYQGRPRSQAPTEPSLPLRSHYTLALAARLGLSPELSATLQSAALYPEQSASLTEPVLQVLAHRHERWDGKGTPLGLREIEIPLASRLLAVVEAFCGLQDTDPTTLRRLAGTQLDPELTHQLLELVAEPAQRRAA